MNVHRATIAADGEDATALGALLDLEPALATVRSEGGFTLLHTAVHGSAAPAVITLLLDRGADPAAITDDGIAPMHCARATAIPLLVAAGASLDPRDHQGRTPLIVWAQERDGLEPMRTLLEHGADPSAVDAAGGDALSYASTRRATEAIQLLRAARSRAARPRRDR